MERIDKKTTVMHIVSKWDTQDIQGAWLKTHEWFAENGRKPYIPQHNIFDKDDAFMLSNIADYLINEGDVNTREVDNTELENGFINRYGLRDRPTLRDFLSTHDMLMEDWDDILADYMAVGMLVQEK